ncbi:MAG TPA: hypothetical protein VKT28_09560 [Puia sp.]|nr:hypothetical protein [Puia sp.]
MKKIFLRSLLIILCMLPVLAFAHFLIFPQETRCMLISFSSFEKDGNLFCKRNLSLETKEQLQLFIRQSQLRVGSFWGSMTSQPKYIYCDNEEDYNRYGVPGSPACTHVKLGQYIVISKEGINPDIIAHETEHAEFENRIGFMKYTFKIPRWFDEGLAMQVDDRDYYSEDTLKVKSNNFSNLPDVKRMKTGAEFGAGDINAIMLNYMTAKHEVKNWVTKEKLEKFMSDISNGKNFDEAFGK